MSSIRLSKSRFMAGLQCPKRLWLQIHQPELVETEYGENLQILNGNEVGEMARQLYPGSYVDHTDNLGLALEETKRLMADPSVRIIHEATFEYDGVLVRVDILERTETGWVLTEVKGATSVKQHYIPDVAIQAWVAGSGLDLQAIRLMHVNNQFVYQGDGNYKGLLLAQDVGPYVMPLMSAIPEQKDEFAIMLRGDEPDIAMGKQCTDPYECEFCAYCMPENVPEYPVSVLPNLREPKKSQLASKYADVRDIPESELTNHNHLRVWRATRNGREEVDVAEAAALSELPWPRYYLDFETIALAVPRWMGMRPYMAAPFQWSCHIHHQDGHLEHVEFLDVTGDDPRRACAESLVENIGDDGVVLAYNAVFEKGVIRALASLYPDLSHALIDIHDRIQDLLPITRRAYYHPSQRGSWSIKAVLPALAPDLSYKDLEGVQHGGDAQLAWMLAAIAPEGERERIAAQLLEYCKLDTLAMVRIVDELSAKANAIMGKSGVK